MTDVTPQQTKVEAGGTYAAGGSATINDRTALYVGILAVLASGISLSLALDARLDAQRSERETRMLEMYVLELDAKLVAAGFKTDAETIAKKLREQKSR